MLTLDQLVNATLEEKTVDLPGLGQVTIRELDAGELLACGQAAIVDDPISETVSFDAAKHTMLKVATSLVSPTLGSTLDERVLNYEKLRGIPGRAYQALVSEVEKLTNIDLARVAQLSQIIDSVPFLFTILEVLADKNGWLADLDGKTLEEFRLWAAFHASQRSRVEAALSSINGG